MWTRELLKRNAKEIFKRNYWTCVGVSLVLAALTGGGSSVIGTGIRTDFPLLRKAQYSQYPQGSGRN